MIYNFRTDLCYLIGDTHDQQRLYELISTRIPNDSDVVFVGDGGLGFGNKEVAILNTLGWLTAMNRRCVEMNVRLFILRGNHDATYPEIWDSTWSNVFLTKSGDVGIFPNGKKALLIGGGISVDRCVRKEWIDYWKDEITPILENVESCDILFSHDTAEWFNHPTRTLPDHFGWYVIRDHTLMDDALKQRNVMADIIKRSGVKTQFYGHFHQSLREEKFGVYAQCLDINELSEFDAEKEYSL